MKLILELTFLVAVATVVAGKQSDVDDALDQLDKADKSAGGNAQNANVAAKKQELWKTYLKNNGKNYNINEEKERFKIFDGTVNRVLAHNREALTGKKAYFLGLNQLSDKTPEEMKQLRGFKAANPDGVSSVTKRRKKRQAGTSVFKNTLSLSQLPASVNWTAQGWVGSVRFQNMCGDCWAHASTGAIEAQLYNVTRQFVNLSVQTFVDCTVDLSYANWGCLGGDHRLAFQYAMLFFVATEASYKTTNQNASSCRIWNKPAYRTKGWRPVDVNETALMQAVAQVGPIAVVLDASGDFQNYKSGIFPGNCGIMNHAVLITGYGTDATTGQAYWIIKNSWDVNWGMNGYMLLARPACNVTTLAAFPYF